MSIETILVPTDFSDDARAALEAAIDLAESFEARLVVVHAYYVDIPAVYGGVGGMSGDFLVPGDVVAPVREGAEQAVSSFYMVTVSLVDPKETDEDEESTEDEKPADPQR